MKIQDLENLMVSVSDIKSKISEIMENKQTKVIVKNNIPKSVIMPYSEYVALNENKEEYTQRLEKIGQDIVLHNGVTTMVVASVGGSFSSEDIVIKVFVKMRKSGDYKLIHTFNLSEPSVESTMTTEEIIEQMNVMEK